MKIRRVLIDPRVILTLFAWSLFASQSLIKVSQSQGIYNIFQKIVIIFLKQAFKVSDNLQYRDNLLSG